MAWRLVLLCALTLLAACGWNPSRPFDRDAPPVRQAIADLDAGDAASAASRLEEYLSTGGCKEGNIGTPEALKKRTDGTFDLGLSLFRIGEQYGRRFGEEEVDKHTPEETRTARHAQVECARRIVEAITEDDRAPIDLRARSLYLQGNLAFLDGAYEQAVRLYDRALVLAPGQTDAGDPVGRDAAWNRAIALRRIEDEKDAGSDAASDARQDSAADGASDSGKNATQDGGDNAGKDASQKDSGTHGDDAGAPPEARPDSGADRPEAGAKPPPPVTDEDDRMLDQLENAPTLQQEEAKRFGKKRVRGMADK